MRSFKFFAFLGFLFAYDLTFAIDKVESISFPIMAYLKSISVIIALLLIMFGFMKYLLKGKSGGIYGSNLMTIVDRMPIEPQVALYVVKVKKKYLMLSIGNKNVTMIQDLSEIIDDSDFQVNEKYSFKDILDKVKLNKKNEDI